jgi:hypothetical protein
MMGVFTCVGVVVACPSEMPMPGTAHAAKFEGTLVMVLPPCVVDVIELCELLSEVASSTTTRITAATTTRTASGINWFFFILII